MRPAITLITPTIPGRGHLLAELAAGVGAQSFMPDAWLVGVDHDRRGPAAMRNALVGQARTEWVSFVDDDDLIDPDHLDIHADHLVDDVDVVFSLARIPGEEVFERILAEPFHPAVVLHDRNTVPVTVTMRRATFVAAGGFDDNLAHEEDWDLWRRALRIGAQFRQVRQTTWTYRLDEAWTHRSKEA